MRRFGEELNGVSQPHRRESQTGQIVTTGDGGKSIAVTNMNSSQLRNLVPITPYGISSCPPSGLMAFVLVADNTGNDGMIGVYDPGKPQCSVGESMLYSSGGAYVKCSGGNVIINGIDIIKKIQELESRAN